MDEKEDGQGDPAAVALSSSPNDSAGSFPLKLSAHGLRGPAETAARAGGERSSLASDDDEGPSARKKLRLSKEQSAFLEESFKEHSTLNPDPDFVVEEMSSTSSSQSSASSERASTSDTDNARPSDQGTNSAGPARSRLALQLDQRSLHFSVNAWVLIVALIGILPMAPRQLQYKGYHLSLLGTTCTTGYVLFAFYGLPRAGNMQAVQAWCHHVTSSKDFIPFMYCLMFLTSKLHLKLVLVPVICWALKPVARFLHRHFTNSSLYRTYLEQPCTWVEANITAVNFLSSNAEILLGFLLILSLFSRQRNAMQTFMYWQLLKLMYHSPFTAAYHRAIWLKIGRTVNPYIHRYIPFLHDPINAGMRWWFR